MQQAELKLADVLPVRRPKRNAAVWLTEVDPKNWTTS